MLGYKRNASSINTIFNERNSEKDLLENRRIIKSSNEGADFNIPNKGSVYDFVKSLAGSKYKKLYPNNTHEWMNTPPKPVCDVAEMFASDDVQKVLLQEDDSILFVPYFKNWGGVIVYIKLPYELGEEFNNNILNAYGMKKYAEYYNKGNYVIKCNEGYYYRLWFLENGMPNKDNLGYVFQGFLGSLYSPFSEEGMLKNVKGKFENIYSDIFKWDKNLRNLVEDWSKHLWEYVESEDLSGRIIGNYKYACDVLQQAYENERIAKEEAARAKQAEKEATTQSYINWIEEGNPVYKIFGWAWKGARYNPIEPDEAISEIRNDRPFEIQYKTINGEQALVLQYVGENDMY